MPLPAIKCRRASLDDRYGILVVRVTAEDMRGGETSLKKIDSGRSEDRQKAVVSTPESETKFDPVPCDLLCSFDLLMAGQAADRSVTGRRRRLAWVIAGGL